jgi:phage internal scaffolding protein
MKPPFLRTAYNYDMNAVSDETGLFCPEPTLAQQSGKDEADINIIMAKFGQGQALPENFRPPQYGDFVGINTYHDAMNQVALANEAFDTMPAEMRARFHNNPVELMAFLDTETNRPEAIKLGLIPPPPEVVPTPPEPSPAPKGNP